jgi:hypothetical protein
MAAALDLMPVYSRPENFFPGELEVATAKYGYLVKLSGTSPTGIVITTTVGEQPFGVVTDQGDPNNSDLFASGTIVSVARGGMCDVMFDAATVITKGDKIIVSGTDGHAKVLEAEVDPYWLLGEAMQTVTIGAAAGLATVALNIQWIAAD